MILDKTLIYYKQKWQPALYVFYDSHRQPPMAHRIQYRWWSDTIASVLMNETNWHFRRLAETLIISDDSSWITLAMNQFWVCIIKLMMISWANLWRDLSHLNSESTNYSPTHDWSKSVLMTRCAFKFQSPSDIYQGSFQRISKLKIKTK